MELESAAMPAETLSTPADTTTGPQVATPGPAATSEAPVAPGGQPEGATQARRAPATRIAIVGFTPSREEAWALLDDPEWEVWGMNNLHLQPGVPPASKFDRWWDLHPREMIEADAPHAAWLAAGADGVPVMMWSARPEWPTAEALDRALFTERFGRYFTNSVSWMLAAALMQIMAQSPDGHRAPEGAAVAVFGVDMATTTEYAAQRPSCEYFLGIAAGVGCQVVLPGTSDLLKCAALYGEDDGGLRRKLDSRHQELVAQLQAHEAEARRHSDAAHQCRGAIDSLDYVRGVWTQPNIDRHAPQNAIAASDGQAPPEGR